jgi:hypothetical protein
LDTGTGQSQGRAYQRGKQDARQTDIPKNCAQDFGNIRRSREQTPKIGNADIDRTQRGRRQKNHRKQNTEKDQPSA